MAAGPSIVSFLRQPPQSLASRKPRAARSRRLRPRSTARRLRTESFRRSRRQQASPYRSLRYLCRECSQSARLRSCVGTARRGKRSGVNLAAALLRGEDFLGIEQSGRIEGVPHTRHYFEFRVGEEKGHQTVFLHANAVLTRDRSALVDAELDDFVGRREHPPELLGIALIEEN